MIANTKEMLRRHDPLAELERQLMDAYLAGGGHNLDEWLARTDDDVRRLLAQASQYASGKLSKVEARAQYVHTLRGEP